MEVGSVTETFEDKQTPAAGDASKDGANKQPNPNQDAKAKDAKPAPERKRTRVLSEDKRFRLFSGSAKIGRAHV